MFEKWKAKGNVIFGNFSREEGEPKKPLTPWSVFIMVVVGIFLVILISAAFTSFYTVSEQERAVVTTFGKADPNKVYGAGLHFKLPFIQSVERVDMTTRGMELGYTNSSNNDSVSVPDESVMITRDFNFVVIDFYIEWRVIDPIKFLYNSVDPTSLLKHIVQSSARSVVSAYDVDSVLTTAKSEIQTLVKENVTEKLDQYDIGIQISNITVQDAEPPTEEINLAFKDVENAKQQKETEINVANRYENTEIPYARSEADRLIKEAESVKESRINEAQGQVQRFNEIYEEYQNNKEVTRTRMYLEAMEEVLPGLKVIVDSGSSDTLKILDLSGGPGAAESGAPNKSNAPTESEAVEE